MWKIFSRKTDFWKKSYKKFVFLKKDGVIGKRKMSWTFRRQVRGNRTKITDGKFCLKKTEKIATPRIFGGFLKNFRRTCLLLLVVDARRAKKIRRAFLPKRAKLSKNSIFRFSFRFCTKILYFLAIWVSFENILNWLFVGTKISTVGRFPEEHPQFINKIRFRKAEFLPFFDGFLHPVLKNAYLKKKNNGKNVTFQGNNRAFMQPITKNLLMWKMCELCKITAYLYLCILDQRTPGLFHEKSVTSFCRDPEPYFSSINRFLFVLMDVDKVYEIYAMPRRHSLLLSFLGVV